MECLLCKIWGRMPYAKRHTTPTTAQETEGALIVGYWVARRYESVPPICERHMNVLQILDYQEEKRVEMERQRQAETEKTVQAAQLIERQQAALRYGQQVEEIQPISPPIVPQLFETPPPPITATPFKLGPGPLPNENMVTNYPPLPVTDDLSAPYRNVAIEAANMPPVEGAKITFPCPACGKQITTGDVHAC